MTDTTRTERIRQRAADALAARVSGAKTYTGALDDVEWLLAELDEARGIIAALVAYHRWVSTDNYGSFCIHCKLPIEGAFDDLVHAADCPVARARAIGGQP